jgi:putative transposase
MRIREVTGLYGTGFNDLVPIRSTKEKESFCIHNIDETVIQIGNQNFWLWFCIEPIHRSVLGIYISKERNMLIAEKFIRTLVEKYGRHPVYTNGGTWYDEACNILKMKHYLHSPLEKSLMERVNQYFKDRIENFDDYYPCMQIECNLFHVHNWIQFFLCQCIMIQHLLRIIILLISYKKRW